MNFPDPNADQDIWSRWLLQHRFGGDAAREQRGREAIQRYADRVLDGCGLAPGMTLADIGSGDGALAFRAIERIGPGLRVLLADVSAPLLAHARDLAEQRGVLGQCSFRQMPAEDLAGMADASVDAIAARAVLVYVADKPAALREFLRVLKPGGRVSVGEPMLRDDAFETMALQRLAEQHPLPQTREALSLLHRWRAAQFPDTLEKTAASPLTNHSERDLLELFQATGFTDLHLELHIDVRPPTGVAWETFLACATHPWTPSNGDILDRHFRPAERRMLEGVLRPIVETGSGVATERIVYLSAGKPAAAAR